MKILSDEEIEEIKPIWSEEYGTARAIEAKVIEKLKEKSRRMLMVSTMKVEAIIDDFCDALFEEES